MANNYEKSFQNLFGDGLFKFDSTSGQIIPQTSGIKEAIRAALVEAFGVNINTEDETPAGRIIEMWTLFCARFCSLTALYANQLNPQYATGQMLDAVGALFSTKRNGATPTVITCTFGGTTGVEVRIPAGAKISDNAGHTFTVDNLVVIPIGSSTATGTATCTTNGKIQVDSNTVTNVDTTISGWNYVSNTGTVSVGYNIESDYHFRKRVMDARWTGTAFLEDIRAELMRVNGVDSVFVAENVSSSAKYLIEGLTIISTWASGTYNQGDKVFYDNAIYTCKTDNYSSSTAPSSDSTNWDVIPNAKYIRLKEHSILVVVTGAASSLDIGEAIYATKSAGCGFSGLGAASQQGTVKGSEIIEMVQDPNSGVTYPILYNRPIETTFTVNISVAKNKYIGSNEELIAQVKSAIVGWASGDNENVDGIQLGQSIYSYEIGAAVSDAIPLIQIQSVVLKKSDDEADYASIPLFVNELGVLDDSNITVTVS